MGIEKGLRQEFPLEKITKDYKLTSIPEPREAVPKVLPQAPELEVAVLSAMIIDPDCIPNVAEILKPECFYKEEHRIIFETIIDLFETGKSVDLFILNQELKKRGLLEKVGGATYLTEISNAVATSANVEEYAKVIHDKYILREIIKMSNVLANSAFKEDADAFELLDFAEKKLFEISAEKFKSDITDFKKALKQVLEKYEMINREKRHLTGVSSGFPEIDAYTGGFQKSDLIIIAGRPGMGKTAFALSIARNAAVRDRVPVGIFSLEMSLEQIALRLISMEANVDMHALRTGRLSADQWQRIAGFVGRISDAPIFIDDTPALSTLELRAKARRLKSEHNIGLIIVDYLQLMQPPKAESREREISMISRALKSLAKELEIPVIALSQLRRAVEERGDKRPLLSDLRESGSLEQDADVVIFVHRPEYYGITVYEDGSPTEGTAEIIISKQRNGPLGTIKLSFLKHSTKFAQLEIRRTPEGEYDLGEPEPPGKSPF
ncbi:MAG: replicative DNA helicase [Candidatus Kryptonium sp.]